MESQQLNSWLLLLHMECYSPENSLRTLQSFAPNNPEDSMVEAYVAKKLIPSRTHKTIYCTHFTSKIYIAIA